MLLHLEFPWVSIAPNASPREQLRYYREYRGLLRRELGDMTGISETTILNYELGYMPIAYDKAKRLAKALEIDEKLLFDDYCRFLDYPFQLRCKELRLELGLTQVEIADKAGIARGTYGTWECAAVRPGREPFQKFAAFIIASFDEYDLLIIDDLGVERSTEYAMEQMFFVIDSRYRSRRPMIITTNLKLAELKNPPDLAHARIYDRILERCAPILFAGKNFREENAGATKQSAKDIVNRKSE